MARRRKGVGAATPAWRTVAWDGVTLGEWTREIDGADEPGAPDTWNFSIDVAKSWERVFVEVAAPAARPEMRKVALRAAMVMNPERGSTFDLLLGLVRFGLGGRAGDGRQFMSWIHHADFVRAILWLIEHEEISGP